MKSFVLIITTLALIGTLLSGGIAQADDPAAPVVLIYAPINENPRITGFEVGQSNFAPEFYAGLRDLLIAEGYTPVFFADPLTEYMPDFFKLQDDVVDESTEWTSITQIGIFSYGERDAVVMTQFANFQFPPLPMGPYGMTPYAMIDAEYPASLDEAIRASAGVIFYAEQDCDRALPYLIEASESEQLIENGVYLYPSLMFHRAGCAYLAGNVEQAITAYRAAIEFDAGPDDQTDLRIFSDYAAINLAWIYANHDQPTEALALLDQYTDVEFLSYNSREMERYLERAWLYVRVGDPDQGLAELDGLIAIAHEVNDNAASTLDEVRRGQFALDEMARLYTERGHFHFMARADKEAALADFDRAIDIDPTYPKAYYWRGMMWFDSLADDAALADLEQFLALAPDYYNYYEEDYAPLIAGAQEYIGYIKARRDD